MIRTELCRLLGITHPIVQAGMGGVAGPRLAAAVSAAGALGMLGVYRWSPAALRAAVREARALGGTPVGVNFVPDVLGAPELDERVDAALDEGVRIVSFFSQASPETLARVHRRGALALVQVGSVAQADEAVHAGADVLIAQGWEAGGHLRGEVALLPLVTAVARRWPRVPMLASGGIATGEGLAAALAAGAGGAWIGTRFVAALESEAHPEYQRRVAAAGAADTLVTRAFFRGWSDAPHRVLRNSTTAASEVLPPRVIGLVRVDGGRVPVVAHGVTVPTRTTDGAIEAMAHYCGQGCELIGAVEPAAVIVARLVEEAEAVVRQLAARVEAAPAAVGVS